MPRKNATPCQEGRLYTKITSRDTTEVLATRPFQRSAVLRGFDDQTQSAHVLALAKDRIRLHSHLSVQRIWCEYDGAQLYLRGQVPSFYLKQLAQSAVSGIDGVSQVVNEIEVLW
jgi:osmotically-inducible protein OsmY